MFIFIFGTSEVFDHLVGFLSSREMISRPGIEPLTTPFGLGTSLLSSGSSRSSRTMICRNFF